MWDGKQDIWEVEPDAIYSYRDKQNKEIYQICRYHICDEDGNQAYKSDGKSKKKSFRVRIPLGSGRYAWSLKKLKIDPILYNLPLLEKARQSGETVFFVEGEKDADNAVKKLGVTATTNPFGAKKWNEGNYTPSFEGLDVVIVPDNDSAGFAHIETVARAILTTARSVRVLYLPGLEAKDDLSDWIDKGGTREEFFALVDQAQPYTPTPPKEEEIEDPEPPAEIKHKSAPVDQSAHLAMDWDQVRKSVLWRYDLKSLILQAGAKPGVSKGTYTCPFHNDEEATFWTFEGKDKNERWCCGHGGAPCGHSTPKGYSVGDSIDLFAWIHSCSLGEATRDMAKELGIEIPKPKLEVIKGQGKGKKGQGSARKQGKNTQEGSAKKEPDPRLPSELTDLYEIERSACEMMEQNGIIAPKDCFTFWPLDSGDIGTVRYVWRTKKIEGIDIPYQITETLAHTPVWISANVQNLKGDLCGSLVEFEDRLGRRNWEVLFGSQLDARSKEFNALRDRGLVAVPQKRAALCDYLAAFRPKDRVILVDRVASESIKDKWTVALPYALWRDRKPTIQLVQDGEEIPKAQSDTAPPVGLWRTGEGEAEIWSSMNFQHLEDTLERKGSWWQRQEGLKRLTFKPIEEQEGRETLALSWRCVAITAALTALVRPMTGWDGFGLHFHGQSGSGKSSILQLAASCIGRGSRPGTPGSYLRTWEGTPSGLQATAALFFGLPFVIDELRTGLISKDIGSLIYQFTSGEGKARANEKGGLAKKARFQTVMLSSGELSLRDVMRSVGLEIKEGQAVRMIDLRVDRTTWRDKEESEECQRFASETWGHEACALIEELTRGTQDQVNALLDLRKRTLTYYEKHLAPSDVSRTRILGHFGSMAAVGEYCAERGILPWPPGYATRALYASAQAAISNAHVTEGDRAIANLRENLLKYQHMHLDLVENTEDPETFQKCNRVTAQARFHRMGFWLKDAGIFALTSDCLREWAGEIDPVLAANELRSRNLLEHTDGRLQQRVRIKDVGRPILYQIKQEILDGMLAGEIEEEIEQGQDPQEYIEEYQDTLL